MQAGLAFGNARVALVHAMAGPLATIFHLSHGYSNAVLLPDVMAFSAEACPEKYAEIARAMGEGVSSLTPADAAQKAADSARKLLKDLRVESLREMGVTESDLEQKVEKMAEDAIAGGSPKFNPRKASKEDIMEIYFKAYEGP
ncbi:MAG: iron-containing alcohol dehydrogenase [Methanobacteriota archaeon]